MLVIPTPRLQGACSDKSSLQLQNEAYCELHYTSGRIPRNAWKNSSNLKSSFWLCLRYLELSQSVSPGQPIDFPSSQPVAVAGPPNSSSSWLSAKPSLASSTWQSFLVVHHLRLIILKHLISTDHLGMLVLLHFSMNKLKWCSELLIRSTAKACLCPSKSRSSHCHQSPADHKGSEAHGKTIGNEACLGTGRSYSRKIYL